MIKKINVAFYLLTICLSHAMDKSIETEQPKINTLVCYLAWLPNEILDYVAQYLKFNNWETDKELFERTKPRLYPVNITWFIPDAFSTRSDINSLIENDLNPNNYSVNQIGGKTIVGPKKKMQFTKKSALGNKIITLDACRKKVIVIDRKKNYQFQRDVPLIMENAIAVASSNNSRAIVPECAYYQMIQLRDIVSHRYKNYSITYYDTISSIDFNKQDTKLIVRGSESNEEHHEIIPIVPDEKCEERRIKTFANFLNQHGVCKNLESSL